jgi:hypothetical protein
VGVLAETALRGAVEAVYRRLPVVSGKVGRDWVNLAPYWKVRGRFDARSVALRVASAEGEAEAEKLFVEHVNTPLEGERQHVRFLLVKVGEGRSRLGMVFDHRLFDAFGAEAFLRLIAETHEGRLEEFAGNIRQTEPAHLDQWKKRFAAGKKLGAVLRELTGHTVAALRMPRAGVRRRVAFVHERLSAEETEAFINKAGVEIGAPIVLPSAAARAVAAVRKALPAMPLEGTHTMLFTTLTSRVPGREWEALFFNPYAFVPLSAENGAGGSVKELSVLMRDQFFQLIKKGVPGAMFDAALLGRIFPRWVVNKVMRRMGQGRFCTFYFACVKETGFGAKTFLGLPVRELVHTPQAFSPPGINLCMTFFEGRFNIVLSYLEGVVTEGEARGVVAEFRAMLVG